MDEVINKYVFLWDAIEQIVGLNDAEYDKAKEGLATELLEKSLENLDECFFSHNDFLDDEHRNDSDTGVDEVEAGASVLMGEFIKWAWLQEYKADSLLLNEYKEELPVEFQEILELSRIDLSIEEYKSSSSIDSASLIARDHAISELEIRRKKIFDRNTFSKSEINTINKQQKNAAHEVVERNQQIELSRKYKNDYVEPKDTSDIESKTKDNIDSIHKQRIDKIIEVAKLKGYELLAIEYGGKAAIQTECLKFSSLFTESTFLNAWKRAKKLKLIEVQNVDVYRKSDIHH